jgi:hypothetical protein
MGTTICFGAVAIWFYMDRLGRMKVKKMENDPELKAKNNALEIEIALMMHEMGVPTSAKPMDVLVFNYKTKDGVPQPVSPAMLPQIYMNFECKTFSKDDCICIADSENVYTFEKNDVKMLRQVNSRTTVYSWNKQENPTDSKYAAYGVSLNKMGMATTSSYYIVEIEKDGETFGLYVPSYEAEALREVFGFDAALDEDGDMIELPSYVENMEDEDNVAENALPEAENSEVEEPTDEPENSEEEEASTDDPENSDEEEDSEDEEAYDEADTNEGESDEEPEEAAEETKE